MALPKLRTEDATYDYKEWRSYFLFQLRGYRQGLIAGKKYWQEGLAVLRQARNAGLAC